MGLPVTSMINCVALVLVASKPPMYQEMRCAVCETALTDVKLKLKEKDSRAIPFATHLQNACKVEMYRKLHWHGPPWVLRPVEKFDPRDEVTQKHQTKTLVGLCEYMINEHHAKIGDGFGKNMAPGTICETFGFQECKMKRKASAKNREFHVMWEEESDYDPDLDDDQDGKPPIRITDYDPDLDPDDFKPAMYDEMRCAVCETALTDVKLKLQEKDSRKIPFVEHLRNACKVEMYENLHWHGPPWVLKPVEKFDPRDEVTKKRQTKSLVELCRYMLNEHNNAIGDGFRKGTAPGKICGNFGFQGCKMQRKASVKNGEFHVVWEEESDYDPDLDDGGKEEL